MMLQLVPVVVVFGALFGALCWHVYFFSRSKVLRQILWPGTGFVVFVDGLDPIIDFFAADSFSSDKRWLYILLMALGFSIVKLCLMLIGYVLAIVMITVRAAFSPIFPDQWRWYWNEVESAFSRALDEVGRQS